MNPNISNVLFISHGGGPLPLLGDPGHQEMVACLQQLAGKVKKPKAILLISAHWEEQVPSITSAQKPALIYDYHGFPSESYSIEYPASGEPVLANQVYEALVENSIEARLDDQRGFDHGLFVPMKIMFPDADIPCVQLSLSRSLNPDLHIQIGAALNSIDYDDLLIIGSGFSFHNLRAFFSQSVEERERLNSAFENWLIETMTSVELSESDRKERLTEWDKAPGARYCHPREEHLLPLHVCYGVTQAPSQENYLVNILGVKSSMCLW